MEKLRKLIINTLLFSLFIFSIVIFEKDVFAAPALSKNDEGTYCINNEEDYYNFISDTASGETYEGQRVVLCRDIKVVGKEHAGTFSGTFDGLGYTIDYTAIDQPNYINVLPYFYNASLENLTINVHEHFATNNTDNSNYDYSILDGSFSTFNKLHINGDISFAYNSPGKGVNISAIKGGMNLVLKNIAVGLNYDFDNEKSNLSDLDFSNELIIYLNIIGMDGDYIENMVIENFYSKSSYSNNVKELANYFENNLDNNQRQGMITKTIYCDPNGSTVENVFFDKDENSEIKVGTLYQSWALAGNTHPNDDSFGKATVDMKLQSTYTGFDFDNIWDMSDTYNDGYPFIVAEDVKVVKKLITDLPDQITESQKDIVNAAKTAYDALSDNQKPQVPAELVQKLNDAVKALEKKEEDEQPQKSDTKDNLKKGTKITVGSNKYQVTGDKTVTFIGAKNKKTKKITVPASITYKKQTFKVTSVGAKACKGYKKLTTFVIGKNVTTIGAQAFANTPKLKKIQVQTLVLKKVGSKACKGMNKKGVIKVPKKMLKKYKKLFKGKGQKKTVKVK